jgi:hypothetical protein
MDKRYKPLTPMEELQIRRILLEELTAKPTTPFLPSSGKYVPDYGSQFPNMRSYAVYLHVHCKISNVENQVRL